MERKEVLYSVEEGIGRIVINRPEKKNTLNNKARKAYWHWTSKRDHSDWKDY